MKTIIVFPSNELDIYSTSSAKGRICLLVIDYPFMVDATLELEV